MTKNRLEKHDAQFNKFHNGMEVKYKYMKNVMQQPDASKVNPM
jgi:hypothetical protein